MGNKYEIGPVKLLTLTMDSNYKILDIQVWDIIPNPWDIVYIIRSPDVLAIHSGVLL